MNSIDLGYSPSADERQLNACVMKKKRYKMCLEDITFFGEWAWPAWELIKITKTIINKITITRLESTACRLSF